MAQGNPRVRPDEEAGTYVFLLGAGCSLDSGAPVMNGFMRKVREYASDADYPFREDYEALNTFRHDCFRISYVMDRWWENIEDLYTQVHLRTLIDEQEAPRLAESIERVIWDVYRRSCKIEDRNGYLHFAWSLHRLARDWYGRGRPRPVVITTNYDTHLERHLLSVDPPNSKGAELRVVYPGKFDSVEAGNGVAPEGLAAIESSRCPMLAVEVVKVHGSVNWFNKAARRIGDKCA